MKISIRDLLWLTALVAVLLAWRLQWQQFQRERDAMRVRAITIRLLSEQYANQAVQVNQLAAKVNSIAGLQPSRESTLELEFAKADLQRAKDFRDAIAARVAKLSGDEPALGK